MACATAIMAASLYQDEANSRRGEPNEAAVGRRRPSLLTRNSRRAHYFAPDCAPAR